MPFLLRTFEKSPLLDSIFASRQFIRPSAAQSFEIFLRESVYELLFHRFQLAEFHVEIIRVPRSQVVCFDVEARRFKIESVLLEGLDIVVVFCHVAPEFFCFFFLLAANVV